MAADFNQPQWQDDALCKGSAAEMFPEPGDWRAERRAQRICWSCPVRHDCLKYAVGQGIVEGVWGGLTEKRRSQLRGVARGLSNKEEVRRALQASDVETAHGLSKG